MKTSNKLLIGLFTAIVFGMIITNIVVKKEMDKFPKSTNQVEISMPSDSLSGDSIALDSAISIQ